MTHYSALLVMTVLHMERWCQIGIVPKCASKCEVQTAVSEVSNGNTTKCSMQKAEGRRPSEHGTPAFHMQDGHSRYSKSKGADDPLT